MTWTRSRFLLSRLDYSTDQLHKLLTQGFRTEVNFWLKTLFFILFELTWNKDFNLWMISGLMFCLLTYKVWSSNQLCVWAFNIEILPEDRDWETKSAYLRPEGKTEKEIVGLWSKQSVLYWFPSNVQEAARNHSCNLKGLICKFPPSSICFHVPVRNHCLQAKEVWRCRFQLRFSGWASPGLRWTDFFASFWQSSTTTKKTDVPDSGGIQGLYICSPDGLLRMVQRMKACRGHNLTGFGG